MVVHIKTKWILTQIHELIYVNSNPISHLASNRILHVFMFNLGNVYVYAYIW